MHNDIRKSLLLWELDDMKSKTGEEKKTQFREINEEINENESRINIILEEKKSSNSKYCL